MVSTGDIILIRIYPTELNRIAGGKMNGLKYIRIRCNLSLTELADILDVTRQALSSWENGKKAIPEQRKKELPEYFGLDSKYFGELSDEDKNYILTKAMFRYELNGKEIYRFKPDNDPLAYEWTDMICFPGDQEISLNEELSLAKQKKQETLDKIDKIIGNTTSPFTRDHIDRIHGDCAIYEMINNLMIHLKETDYRLKVPFLFEMTGVYRAMLTAYGLLNKSELEYKDDTKLSVDDVEWTVKLSELLKKHWDDKSNAYLERCKKSDKNRSNTPTNPSQTVAEQFETAEKEFRAGQINYKI